MQELIKVEKRNGQRAVMPRMRPAQPPQGHFFIYVMRDPDTQAVVYVGMTGTALRFRLTAHFAGKARMEREAAAKPFSAWKLGLIARGIRPPMEVVATARWAERCEVERSYILYYKQLGPLFNIQHMDG